MGLVMGACQGPVVVEDFCDAFMVMLEDQWPDDRERLSPRAQVLKRKACLRAHHKWAREDPEGFQVAARCALKYRAAAAWARCGVAQQGG